MSNFPLRISAILCGSAVYTSYSTHYRRVAEDRGVTQRGLLRQSIEYYYRHGSEVRKRDLGSAIVRNFASPLWARVLRSSHPNKP
jgi:hypothetical protein